LTANSALKEIPVQDVLKGKFRLNLPKTISTEFIKNLLLKSFWAFCQIGLGFKDLAPIHAKVCQVLESPTKRKLIVLPRGFFKSSIASIAYPLWKVCQNPNLRILLVAKSQINAAKRVRLIRTRGIEKNPLLQILFPFLLPKNRHKIPWSDEQTTVSRTIENMEGTFESAGINTALPSRHYDIIIADDIIAADSDEMTDQFILPSPIELRQAIGWHKMMDTLVTPPIDRATVIHIATRWDRQDVVNYILEKESDRYEIFIRGATNEKGESFFPSFYPIKTLNEIRQRLGSQMYSLMYDNIPLATSDHLIQQGQIQYFVKEPTNLYKAIGIDPAFSNKKTSSCSVILVTGMDQEGNVYILDYVAKQGLDPTQTINILFSFHQKYLPNRVGIEAVAYQGTLIHHVQKEMSKRNYRFAIEELKPKGVSKEVRIQKLQPLAEGGQIYVKPEQGELIKELYDYPASRSASYDLLDILAYLVDLLIPPSKKVERTINDLWSYESIMESLARKRRGDTFPYFNYSHKTTPKAPIFA
jgi:predicted phage terminase large subunit-like protein